MFKHHQHYYYNRGKSGLDKSAEVGLHIYKSTPTSLKTKFFYLLMDKVLVNFWRAEIAVTVLKPYIMQLEQTEKRYTTVEQIRRKFHNTSTVDDYMQKFAESYLYALHTTN